MYIRKRDIKYCFYVSFCFWKIIFLPEVKEPIHTLWIKISFEDKSVKVIPMFDKEVKEYIELKEVEILNQSK